MGLTAEQYKRETTQILMRSDRNAKGWQIRRRIEKLLEIEDRALEKCRNKSFGTVREREPCPSCGWYHE